MPKEALTAIAAGLASAFAAMAFLSGAAFAIGLVYLAPLPMLMVGLAYGQRAAITAAITGATVMTVFGGFVLAIVFVFVHAMPTWMIVKLALMVRQSPSQGGDGSPSGSGSATEWMPPGFVISAMAFFASGLLISAAIVAGDGGLSGFVATNLDQIFRSLAPGLEATERGQMTQTLIPLFPGTVATSWVIMAAVNTVIAQGLLVRIGHNRRPSPSYVGLELPQWLSWPLVGAAALALAGPGEWEYLGQNLAMVLALPYFFLGLAVFHTLARRVTATIPVLVTFYLVIVISIWAALVVAGIGVVEQWFGLRNRLSQQTGGGLQKNDEDE